MVLPPDDVPYWTNNVAEALHFDSYDEALKLARRLGHHVVKV